MVILWVSGVSWPRLLPRLRNSDAQGWTMGTSQPKGFRLVCALLQILPLRLNKKTWRSFAATKIEAMLILIIDWPN